jgi:DNA-binding response OmpR family regulator
MSDISKNLTALQKKILLVDDSRSFLLGVKELLGNNNLELRCVSNAKAALEEMSTQKFDFIISDLEMPGMDGFEFIKRVRAEKNTSTVPILAMTGSTDTESMSRAISCGADAFCSKETIRYTLASHIEALSRLQETYEKSAKGLQLEAVQALIGTYKHEFGNALAILDGKLRKLVKEHPAIVSDPSLESVQKSLQRINNTLTKLDSLRHFEEIGYSGNTKILKVG